MRLLVDLLILVAAATFEVAGDAMIRSGLRGRGALFVVVGIAVVGVYGLVVNLVPVDFSKLIGVYVAVFAVVGVLVGKLVFHESVPPSTWLGLTVIVAGAAVVQMGIQR